MVPSPRPDPRLPPLLPVALLAALLVTGWPRPLFAQVASTRTRPLAMAAGAPAGLAPPQAAVAASDPASRWRPPLDGPLTVARPFQPPATPYGAGHRGVDLAAPVGAVVRAAGEGVVTFAGVLAGRGVVAVSHGALRTTYEPLTVLVTIGQQVRAGTPVGRLAIGHPGCAAPSACLHWGLLRGTTYLSPLTLLLPGPPRLLPLDGAP